MRMSLPILFRRVAIAAWVAGSVAIAACGGAVTPSSPSPVSSVPGSNVHFDYHGQEPTPPVGAGAAPGAPCGLTYTPSNIDPVLTWRAPIDCDPANAGGPPTSYIVEVGNQPGESLVVIDTGSTATSFMGGNEGPLDGRGYARVRAQNEYGVGPPSEEIRYNNHGN